MIIATCMVNVVRSQKPLPNQRAESATESLVITEPAKIAETATTARTKAPGTQRPNHDERRRPAVTSGLDPCGLPMETGKYYPEPPWRISALSDPARWAAAWRGVRSSMRTACIG